MHYYTGREGSNTVSCVLLLIIPLFQGCNTDTSPVGH